MASSLPTCKFPMSCGPFFRGFFCAGGVDSGLGEVDDDVEVLGSDFMGMRSSALGERLMSRGTWSSILTSSDGAGDGRTSSTETGGSHILTRSDSTYTLDGDVEGWSSNVMDDVEARGEGLPSSTLRAIARNLDMARTGTSKFNQARVG